MVKLFLIFLLMLNTALSARSLTKTERELRDDISIATRDYYYYKTTGSHYGDIDDPIAFRKWRSFRPFATSAIRVGSIFKSVLPEDRLILKLHTLGGVESLYKMGFVNVNVPGMKYASGKVKFFSLDYTAYGLNDRNVKRTYEIARMRQLGEKLTRKHGNKEFIRLMNSVRIPKNIKLKKIDTSPSIKAKQKYDYLTRIGKTPKEIYGLITIDYTEDTQDDLDSALIYRAIIELERYTLGWKYNITDEELYSWLRKNVKK